MDHERYKRDGFLLCRGFLDPAELRAVREEAQAIFLAQMRRLDLVPAGDLSPAEFEDGMEALFRADIGVFSNCGKQAQHLISLHRLSLDERLIAALRDLGLERPHISTRPLLYFNAQRLARTQVYWKLDSHQDWRSMQGSLDSMVVWVPLVDLDHRLGPLEVIPGSHTWGLLDAEMKDGYGHLGEAPDEAGFLSLEVQLGDVLFFSSLLVHRSGTNVTESIRWSCHFRYNNLAEPTFVERGFPHPYLYRPQEELITEGFPTRATLSEVFS